MVSSGTVNGDLQSIESTFSSYNSSISGLSGVWKGPSYDSFSSKTNEFASSYLNTIKGGMTAFAAACKAYEEYKYAEENLNISKGNLSKAQSNNDSSAISTYSSEVSKYEGDMNKYKSEIESQLAKASAATLQAEATSIENFATGKTTSGTPGSANATIQAAMDWAIAVAADDTHGYSQSTRYGNPNYDCSSLVISAWEAAGVPVEEAGAGYTGNMRSAFTNVGFEWIPGNPNMDDLQPGDVLLNENSHTEMYVGNGMNVGAHSNYDGSDGDSSGNEINVQEYHGSWDGVLRYTGETQQV